MRRGIPAKHGVPASKAAGEGHFRAGAFLRLVNSAEGAAELATASGIFVSRHLGVVSRERRLVGAWVLMGVSFDCENCVLFDAHGLDLVRS